MSNFTPKQRRALVSLAQRYAPAVHALVTGRDGASLDVGSNEVAALVDEFANDVVAIVLRKLPEHAGHDEAGHVDAELSV